MSIERERHQSAKRLLTVGASLMLVGGHAAALIFLGEGLHTRALMSFIPGFFGAIGLYLARTERLSASLVITCLVTFFVMTEAHMQEGHNELAPLYAAPVALLAVVVLRRTAVVMAAMLAAVVTMRALRWAVGIDELSLWLTSNVHLGAILLLWTVLMLWVVARDERSSTLLAQAVQRGDELRALAEREADLAVEASAAKSRFLAAMSHQLRTPLNAVRGYAELLREDLTGVDAEPDVAPSAAEDLGRIISASDLLLRQVDEVLDVSKVESGQLELEVVPMDLGALVNDTVQTVAPLARTGSNRLVVEGADTVGQVVSDPGKVRQVLLNLLSNACKFTRRGVVTVRVRGDVDHVVLVVADTGIGMAPEAVDELFQPYTQAGGVDHRGTGLGLPLCLEFSRALGGTLSVDTALGQGAAFTLRLPRHPPEGTVEVDEAPPSRQRHRVLEAFRTLDAERETTRTVWFGRILGISFLLALLGVAVEGLLPSSGLAAPVLATVGCGVGALLARRGQTQAALWAFSILMTAASWVLHLTPAGTVAVAYPIALAPLIALVAPRAHLVRGIAFAAAALVGARLLRALAGADMTDWWLVNIDVGVVGIGTLALVWLVEQQASREAQVLGQAAFDREALQDRYQEMARAARNASSAKDRFLAAMSHELRTPLGAILGYTELLDEELGPDSASHTDLAQIHTAASHLLRTVDEVLDLAKAHAGQLEPTLVQVDGTTLLEGVPLAEGPELGTLVTDPWFVQRAIACVMAQGVRQVDATADPHALRLGFLVPGDWGSQQALEARLEPFALDPAADPGDDTGVGLALARTLVTHLGGALEAEALPGEARFVLVVPRGAEPPAG